ncbi:MAG: hypothetical protein ACO1TE_17365 [Prosthecobacter sp.]
MSFYAIERWGESEDLPSEERMRGLLATLDIPDPEHPDVSLSHEDGWTLSFHEGGLAVWENVENLDLEPRHMSDVSREDALRWWLMLSKGDMESIERLPWKQGHRPPMSDEEREKRQREVAAFMLASSRSFYDSLGPENPAKLCRHEGCTRGTVRFSVLCRPHHYENVYHQTCPFQH